MERRIVDAIPRDVRSVLALLNIEPDYTLYACCPSCSATYRPDPKSPKDPYPHHCTHRDTPDREPCGSVLVTERTTKSLSEADWIPVKSFAYQSLHAWIGQLLSRPGLEDTVIDAWKEAGGHESSRWKDIWDAPAIRTFLGPDNKTLFSVQPHGSVHLVFSLFIDWFNPFGNKKAGKSHSVGAIYMACLNLPPHLRYRTENIYLAGIMAGPHEPSVHQLNHFLRPLVNELLVLWDTGIFLSRTRSRKTGRIVRAAIIPLVCDLPALRKTVGLAAHSSHNFCSHCRLQRSDINNLDRTSWQRRTWHEHFWVAEQWKNSSTHADREKVFEEHGIRWSELLRLPYWDPTRYALIDAMHNLFLGELHHHCMEVWGIDVKADKATKTTVPHTPEEQESWLKKVIDAIVRGSESALVNGPRKGYIAAVAELNDVIPPSGELTKKNYAHALINWVCALSAI